MRHAAFLRPGLIVAAALAGTVTHASAQTTTPPPDARVSVFVTSAQRSFVEADTRLDTELATSFTYKTPDMDARGIDIGADLRHVRYSLSDRPQRVSLYEGFAGMRFGEHGQLRLRAGHMWLPDLGTVGALAGGLVEYRQPPSAGQFRLRFGAFTGVEPIVYGTGYASGVRKHGAYAAIERGFLQRHVVGYTQVRQGPLLERSVLSLTNFVPGSHGFFVYQAAEFDLKGPANGAAASGLSYFLANVRVSPASRLELQGTYNRGHSLDARRLTEDLLNDRPLTPQAIEGLRYESAGGRVTVQVARQAYVYAGYARDRNNRDDAPTARITIGGHAGNLFGSGFDVSGSDALIDRPTGPYHSRYFSVGHGVGRLLYVSGDYSTSLAVVRFLRSDGLIIETRPWSHRLSGTASVTLNRHLSLLVTLDRSLDEAVRELRVLSGLSYRFR